MAQLYSNSQTDMRALFFPSAANFTGHGTDTGGSVTSDEFPGLVGTYSYGKGAFFWAGGSSFNNSPYVMALAGTSFTVDSAGMPQSGTLTGLYARSAGEGPGGIDSVSYAVGFSISASTFRSAALTSGISDDQAVVRSILAGNDRITLSSQGDYGFGGAGNDVIFGNGGNDTLSGDAGMDSLNGGTGADRLLGGAGRDSLVGGAGADTLTGGEYRDILDGGADAQRDVFVFASASHTAAGEFRDVVKNFRAGTDDLNVAAIDADTDLSGNQTFAFNGTTAQAHAVWYSAITGGVIVKGDVNGDLVADFEIKLEGISAISAGDVLL